MSDVAKSIAHSHFRRNIFLVLFVVRVLIELDTHLASVYHGIVKLYTLASFRLASLWLDRMAGIPEVAQSRICHTFEHSVLNSMGVTPVDGFCGRFFVCIVSLALITIFCYLAQHIFPRPLGRMIHEEVTEFWQNLSF